MNTRSNTRLAAAVAFFSVAALGAHLAGFALSLLHTVAQGIF